MKSGKIIIPYKDGIDYLQRMMELFAPSSRFMSEENMKLWFKQIIEMGMEIIDWPEKRLDGKSVKIRFKRNLAILQKTVPKLYGRDKYIQFIYNFLLRLDGHGPLIGFGCCEVEIGTTRRIAKRFDINPEKTCMRDYNEEIDKDGYKKKGIKDKTEDKKR